MFCIWYNIIAHASFQLEDDMFFRASYETMNWDLVKSFFNYSILYIYVNAIKSSLFLFPLLNWFRACFFA